MLEDERVGLEAQAVMRERDEWRAVPVPGERDAGRLGGPYRNAPGGQLRIGRAELSAQLGCEGPGEEESRRCRGPWRQRIGDRRRLVRVCCGAHGLDDELHGPSEDVVKAGRQDLRPLHGWQAGGEDAPRRIDDLYAWRATREERLDERALADGAVETGPQNQIGSAVARCTAYRREKLGARAIKPPLQCEHRTDASGQSALWLPAYDQHMSRRGASWSEPLVPVADGPVCQQRDLHGKAAPSTQ